MNTDGTENLLPSPPFRIKLPRNLKGNVHALPGNEKSAVASIDAVGKADNGSEKDTLIVEAYIPPDPGPYPQDQPKQNSVRFTPTQVLTNSTYRCLYMRHSLHDILICPSIFFRLWVVSLCFLLHMDALKATLYFISFLYIIFTNTCELAYCFVI